MLNILEIKFMRKVIILGIFLMGGILAFAQGRREDQSTIQVQYGLIPSTEDFSSGKMVKMEYGRVIGDKGWLVKTGIFYQDYEVGYANKQSLSYQKYGLSATAGYTYEGLQPVFLNAYLGIYGGYEVVNKGIDIDYLHNAKIPKPVKGFAYGLTGSAELEVIIIRNFSFVVDYTQFYDLKSSFSKSQYAVFGGFKYYIN